jgi:hypothetical protein
MPKIKKFQEVTHKNLLFFFNNNSQTAAFICCSYQLYTYFINFVLLLYLSKDLILLDQYLGDL